MPGTLPLLNYGQPDDVLVWHQGKAITRRAFLFSAQQLAAQLPDTRHAINLCNGRLGFMLGFAAAIIRGRMTLLPPNRTELALSRLRHDYPDHYILDDDFLQALDLDTDFNVADSTVPAADADAVVATLFTSGSTGAPQPQAKTWRSLARTAELDSLRFAMQQALNLVSTVPAQHMFGLQTAVMLPFMSRCALHDSQPFFPADIRAALESLPAPRALILTPPHLRACVAARLELPELSFILSATAPLTLRLAQQAETLWHTQVLEIYGSTEAGTIATRRSTASELWRLVPGSTLQVTGGETLFHVAHLPEPLRLSDHVEPAGDHEFRLRGRASDQIKVAGKRASLGELTHTLLQIPGIRDAVVFLPETATRTAALVVAPGLNKAEILDLLSQRMDPVFLPRPLIMLKQLPRNEVGKLTQAALGGAIAAHQAGAERAS